MAKESLIYIITNPDFAENCVKIGYTTDLRGRLATFNTGAPKDYEVFATYDVPEISKHKPDKMLHALLTKLDPTIKVNPAKEFFYLFPEEAYDILKYIAVMHDRESSLHLLGIYKKRSFDKKTTPESSIASVSSSRNIYSVSGAKLLSDGNGNYILLKGSVLRKWNGNPINEAYKKQQDELISSGGAAIEKGKIVTKVDLSYKSPSGPAKLVYCCSINGWKTWKNKDGKTIDEIER